MRQLQRKAGVGDFDHLVIHSSIIRPAANRYIREYVRRLKGAAYDPIHPALRQTLDETYGIMCYQEDVTKVAMEMAGFTLAQAEGLRKALSQKRPLKPLRAYQEEFFAGARARGAKRMVTEQVWEMILSFAGYSFCKPHSASYAMVSFRSAWLRAHYPAEFIAAVISNQGGYYSTFAYLSEARRMGLRVLPPDVNASAREYMGSGREVRVGLMQVKGLNEAALASLLAERARGGPFESLADLLARSPLHSSDVELLVKAGACDSIAGGRTRPELLWELYLARGNGDGEGPAGRGGPAGRADRAAALELFAPPPIASPRAPAYDRATVLRHEVETLGFLLSAHPLDLHGRELRARGVIPARELERHAGQRVRVGGWFVTSKLVHTKDDEPMEFLSLEHSTSLYDATLFPDAYLRC